MRNERFGTFLDEINDSAHQSPAIVIRVNEAFDLTISCASAGLSSSTKGNEAMKSAAALAFITLISAVGSAGAAGCTDGKEGLVQQLNPLIKDYTGAYLHTPADTFDEKFTIDYSDFYSDNAQDSENVKECTATVKVEEVGGGAFVKQDVHYRMIITEDNNVLIKVNGVNFASLAQGMMTGKLKKALKIPNGRPLTYDNMPPEMLAPQGPGSTADIMRRSNGGQ